jgi:hypothetical protein
MDKGGNENYQIFATDLDGSIPQFDTLWWYKSSHFKTVEKQKII